MKVLFAALLLVAQSAAGSPGVRGIVLSPAGAPLPGARAELFVLPAGYEQGRLRLAGGEPEAMASALTDELGRYELAAPGPGVFTVRVTAAGTVPLQSGPLPLVDDLDLPAAVPPPDAGARLVARPGLWVVALGEQETAGWRIAPRVGRTAADGSLHIPRLAEESLTIHVFSASGEEVHKDFKGGTISPAAGTASALRLRVVDARGEPVAGVLVRRGEAAWPIGLTGADGTLEIPSPGPPRVLLRLLLMTADGRQQAARLAPGPGETVVLGDAVPVSGRVTSAETGRPLAGALVWSGADPGSFQLTDAGGLYRAGTAVVGSWIEAWAPGRLPKRVTATADSLETGRVSTLALERAAALSGRVVDAAGRGVPGAWVSASPASEGRPEGASTGLDGTFTLARLRPVELYALQAAKHGFLPARADATTASPASPARRPKPVDLVLIPARSALGRVQDAGGRPVPGAEIRILEARGPEERQRPARQPRPGDPRAVADGNGRFTVAEIPALALDVTVTRPGFTRVELRNLKVPPGAGPVDLGTITLQPGATLSGKVVDTRGRPVAGAAVFQVPGLRPAHDLADQLRGQKPHATAGADGRFALPDLAKGSPVHLLVSSPGFLPAAVRGVKPAPKPLLVQLEAGAPFAGRVIDDEGQPVAGAAVELQWQPVFPGDERLQAGPAVVRRANSNREGRFEIPDLPSGALKLAVDAAGFTAERGLEVSLPQAPGAEMTIRLERGASLEGRVSTTADEPVSGARILVGPAVGLSDDEGVFRVTGIPPGAQVVEAQHPHYERLARKAAIEPGTNRLDLVFEAGQEVRGRVVDVSGEPVPGAEIVLGSTVRRDSPWFRGRADAEGAFRLVPVAPGSYRLRATARGHAAGEIDEVRVGEEPVQGLSVVLGPSGSIRGRILGLEPAELPRVEVRIEDESGDSRLAEVDASGSYAVEDLEAGDWLVQASLADGQREVQARVPLPPGGEATRDLEFGGGRVLSGLVLYREEPLADAQVSIRGQRHSVQRFVQTDHEGRFLFEELEADSYWASVTHDRELLTHNQMIELLGDRDVTIRLQVSSVAGTVTDASSREPLADAMVSVRRVAGGDTPEFLIARGTEVSGDFLLPQVPPGRYLMTVTRDGYASAQSDLEVAAGRDVTGLEVALQPSPGVELHVRLASGRIPAVVHLRLLSPAGAVLLSDSRAVGEDGMVNLSTVPPGSWTLLASGTAGALTSIRLDVPAEPAAITFPDAARLAVRVSPLATTDVIATLRIVGAGGQPLQTLGPAGVLQQDWPVIGGKVLVDGIPAGSWTVQAATPDGRAWTGTIATDGMNDAALTLD